MSVNMKFSAPQLFIFILIALTRCSHAEELRASTGECGKARSPYDRIVRGQDVGYMKYPWFATLLLRSMNDRLMCGGSLITRRHVVTAAHCFKPFLPDTEGKMMSNSGAGEKNWLSTVMTILSPGGSGFSSGMGRSKPLKDLYHVKLGVNDICNNEEHTQQLYSTVKVHLHEEYVDKMPFYDIAILELDRDADFMPICLPAKKIEDGQRASSGTIVGLGKTGETVSRLPCRVQEAQVLTFNDTVCTNILKDKNETLTYKCNIFCAGYLGGKVDSCQGDSGGPLQVLDPESEQYTLNGITSFGYGCAQPDVLGIYTDVSAYLDWINSKISASGTDTERILPDVSALFRKQEALMTDSYPIDDEVKTRIANSSNTEVHSINIPPASSSSQPSSSAPATSTSAPVVQSSTSAPVQSSMKIPVKPIVAEETPAPIHVKKIRKKVHRKNYLDRLLEI